MPLTSSPIYSDIEKSVEHYPYTLLSDNPIVVRPLSLLDIWRASKTWVRAFAKDPCAEYLDDGMRPNVWSQRVRLLAILSLWLNNQMTFTAENGAVLNIDIHYPSKPRSRIDKFKDRLVIRLSEASGGKKTPEQAKRNAENTQKITACIKSAIRSERLPEMYQVAIMATDPDHQGRGLGSAVLSAMTQIADKEARDCWLISSNVVNNGFYNANGFFTVGSYFLGDQNPQWTKKPVQVQIMVREPKIALEAPQSSHNTKKFMVITPSSCFNIEP